MHTACLLFQNLPLHQQTKGYNHDNELCWLWAFYYLFAEERKQIILLLYDLGSCTVRFTVEWKTIEAFWPRAFAFFADGWEETLNTRFNTATPVQGCNALLETWMSPQHAKRIWTGNEDIQFGESTKTECSERVPRFLWHTDLFESSLDLIKLKSIRKFQSEEPLKFAFNHLHNHLSQIDHSGDLLFLPPADFDQFNVNVLFLTQESNWDFAYQLGSERAVSSWRMRCFGRETNCSRCTTSRVIVGQSKEWDHQEKEQVLADGGSLAALWEINGGWG